MSEYHTKEEVKGIHEVSCLVTSLSYVLGNCDQQFENDKINEDCAIASLILSSPVCDQYRDIVNE